MSDHLVENGTLHSVKHSEWAAPIVPVPKKDGTIGGDLKVTVNPYLDVHQYSLSKPTELFACITGGQRFTKVDLSSAYQQFVKASHNQHPLRSILLYRCLAQQPTPISLEPRETGARDQPPRQPNPN